MALVEVFCSVGGGSRAHGSQFLHSTHLISVVFGEMTMYEALRSTRPDGFGALGRQSAAAILNAYCRPIQYAFTPIQVRSKFHNALCNEEVAFLTAREFELANNALGVQYSRADAECSVQQQVPHVQSTTPPPVMQSDYPCTCIFEVAAFVVHMFFCNIRYFK
jgi:hypothetical protein